MKRYHLTEHRWALYGDHLQVAEFYYQEMSYACVQVLYLTVKKIQWCQGSPCTIKKRIIINFIGSHGQIKYLTRHTKEAVIFPGYCTWQVASGIPAASPSGVL